MYVRSSSGSAAAAKTEKCKPQYPTASTDDKKLCSYFSWKQNTCQNDDCKDLHICRKWLSNCCQEPCPQNFSHNLLDQHNNKLLFGKLNCNQRAKNDDFKDHLYNSLPKICTDLNCDKKRACSNYNLHLCVNIVKFGSCRFNASKQCPSPNHSMTNTHVSNFFFKFGIDVTKKLKQGNVVRKALTDVILERKEMVDKAKRHENLSLQKGALDICSFYGWGRSGCRNGSNCNSLHVCRAWLGGHCPQDDQCSFLHNLNDRTLSNNPTVIAHAYIRLLECDNNMRDNLARIFPKICVFYNTEGKMCKKNKCAFLHLCSNVAKNEDCQCKRNHDPRTRQVTFILKRFGVNTNVDRTMQLLSNVLLGEWSERKRRCSLCNEDGSAETSDEEDVDSFCEEYKQAVGQWNNDHYSRLLQAPSSSDYSLLKNKPKN